MLHASRRTVWTTCEGEQFNRTPRLRLLCCWIILSFSTLTSCRSYRSFLRLSFGTYRLDFALLLCTTVECSLAGELFSSRRIQTRSWLPLSFTRDRDSTLYAATRYRTASSATYLKPGWNLDGNLTSANSILLADAVQRCLASCLIKPTALSPSPSLTCSAM